MSVKKFCATLVLVLLFNLTADGSSNVLTLHYPPDKSVVESDYMSISLSTIEGFDGHLKVEVNKDETTKILPGQFRCFRVALDLGINTIDLLAESGGKSVDQISITVFRRSSIISRYRTPPPEFKMAFFHMQDHSECTGCHVLDPTEADRKPVNILKLSAKSGNEMPGSSVSTCYSCHKGILSDKYVHGPVAVWSCLSCHDPDSDPRYSVKRPDSDMCYECHLEQMKIWSSKKYVHGPINLGKCTICHEPHGSDYPDYLLNQSWDLCVSCHADSATGKHVLGDAFSTKGHPTRGYPDPLRKGEELTCASCHNSHASSFPNLWEYEVESLFDLCQKCHNK